MRSRATMVMWLVLATAASANAADRVFDEARQLGLIEGVREVVLIRSDMLAVTVDMALGAMGAGPNEEAAAGFQKPDTFLVSSTDDPTYKQACKPAKVGRLSYERWNGDVGGKRVFLYWHTFYLQLPKPMISGRTYRVEVQGIAAPFKAAQEFKYDDKASRTPVIKINQVAYSSLATRRYAYLGWWAADLGTVDYSAFKTFEVVDETSGKISASAPITLRQARDPKSGEDVYQLDLSSLSPGTYHIRIPGLGRSDSFGVGGTGIWDLYYNTQRAFFHQRCGQEFRQPWTTFEKPACHTHVYESGFVVGNRGYQPKPNEAVKQFKGGYHDAADFDTYAEHLIATQFALMAYESAPERFKDGDLSIPESGNGIPDVLDETRWALAFHREYQQTDGSVPQGRGNDQDDISDRERKTGTRPAFGIFPPTHDANCWFAAVGAQYARLMKEYDAADAADALAAAGKAYAWAKAHPAKSNDMLAFAAASLFSATGDVNYDNDFKGLVGQGALMQAQMNPHLAWPYLSSRQSGTDKAIQAKLRRVVLSRADEIVGRMDQAAYRNGMGNAAGNFGWGKMNGGYFAPPCLMAYWLTKDQKYLDAASLCADFQLGANPLSKTFISGMGARPPVMPQISAFLYTGPNKTGTTVKGIPAYGLSNRSLSPPFAADVPQKWHVANWYPKDIPLWRRWRDIGNGGAEVSSEFTIAGTVNAAAILYGTLYAMEPAAGTAITASTRPAAVQDGASR